MTTFGVNCLGTGEYVAVVKHRRTKLVPNPYTIGEVEVRSLNWGRALSATSVADLTVANKSGGVWDQCCDTIQRLGPARAVIEFYRDGDLVWSGPVRSKSYDPDAAEATLAASDLSLWLSWRCFYHNLSPRGIDLADIMDGYLGYLLKGSMPPWGDPASNPLPLYVDDPGLTWEKVLTGVTGDRTIAAADLRMGDAEIGELTRTGCDWTVTNTKMWLGGNELVSTPGPPKPFRLPGHITDEFFANAPRTRTTSDGMGTMFFLRGNAVQVHVGGPDPDDGLLIQRVQDEYSIEDIPSALAAAGTYYDLAHEPLTYVEGDNMLSAGAPVDIQTLIPGTRAAMSLAGGGCVPYDGWLRLDRVQVNVSADEGEKVSVTFQPLGSSFDARGGN